MVERALGREIRRLVEESVPPAPWLDDQVMAAVFDAASGATRTGRRPARFRLAGASFIALLIVVLAVGVLVGSRLGAHTNPAPATHLEPSRDAAVVRYRALVADDMDAVDSTFNRSSACKTRDTCASDLAQMKTATETLLRDISTAPTPRSIAPAAGQVKSAAQQFIVQLDVAIALIQQPGSDYIAASEAPTIHDLDLAVARVECWPAAPIEGDHGITCS